MSAAHLTNFLKALDSVNQHYICGVCKEMCKNPVTLSKCFHIICSEHFAGLKSCPNCKTDLVDCTTFTDERLTSCIDSAKEITRILQPFRPSKKTPKSIAKRPLSDSTEPEKPLSDRTNQNKATLSNPNVSLLSSSSKFNKNIEKRNLKGETALHVACRLGKINRITELLNQGANTNTKDNAGWTPLHEVVQNGRIDLVKLLLQYNTLINVPGQSNETPLHEAVRYNHKDIAAELVKHGADINAQNCKGETPMQLASPDMKAILQEAVENIIHTQSINISHISALYTELDSDEIFIYCTSQYRTVHNKLKSLKRSHNNVQIEAKFTKKVTHLIVDADDEGICASSNDVLLGIVNAVWIVTSEWITKSSDDKLEAFDKFEVVGVGNKSYNGPKNARYNKYKQLPGLFDGCHFYLHNFINQFEISKLVKLTKAILSKLITDAGGIVLRRTPNPESIPEQEKLIPYHAKKGSKLVNCSHYIIFKDKYEPMYNMSHLKALPIGWLIECLEKYELCEPW